MSFFFLSLPVCIFQQALYNLNAKMCTQGVSFAVVEEFRYFYIVLFLTCSIVIIILNVTSLIILFKPSMRSNKSNHFVMSLAISDLLVGTLACPFMAISFIVSEYGDCDLIRINMIILYLMSESSLSSLAAIAYDRFLMTNPTNYHNRMTSRVVKIILTVLWSVPPIKLCIVLLNDQVFISSIIISNPHLYHPGHDCHCGFLQIDH